MSQQPRFVTVMQPPPGPSIRRPTRADPEPAGNPPVFTHAMAVRDAVFVDEQRCSPDMELDEDDSRSWHWVMYDTEATDMATDTTTSTTSTGKMSKAGGKEDKRPIGVVRLVPPPHAPHEHLRPTIEDGVDCTESLARHHRPFVRVTRVALLKEFRGRGLSRDLVDVALQWAAAHPEKFDDATDRADRWDGVVLVHAQTRSEGLYQRLGFTTDKGLGTWVEERMEHLGMWQTIKVKGRP